MEENVIFISQWTDLPPQKNKNDLLFWLRAMLMTIYPYLNVLPIDSDAFKKTVPNQT